MICWTLRVDYIKMLNLARSALVHRLVSFWPHLENIPNWITTNTYLSQQSRATLMIPTLCLSVICRWLKFNVWLAIFCSLFGILRQCRKYYAASITVFFLICLRGRTGAEHLDEHHSCYTIFQCQIRHNLETFTWETAVTLIEDEISYIFLKRELLCSN